LAKSEDLEWQAKRSAKDGKSVGSAATRGAIAELEAGEGKRLDSVEALMADLRSES
jgi:hypothetical protein